PARMARALSGRDLQLVGDMREVFEAPIVMSVDDVLDPHAQSARRIIEAGLHGEERSGQDEIRIARGAEARALVDLEADAVPQSVYVPLLDALVLADRPVPVRLEEVANTFLIDTPRRSDRQAIHGLPDRVAPHGDDVAVRLHQAGLEEDAPDFTPQASDGDEPLRVPELRSFQPRALDDLPHARVRPLANRGHRAHGGHLVLILGAAGQLEE